MKLKEEFYIGYHDEAPEKTSRFIKAVVALTIAIIAVVCVMLVQSQQKFPDTTFEYGTLTKEEGILLMDPVPHLVVAPGDDNLSRIVLLVGAGKKGAQEGIHSIGRWSNKNIIGRYVTLQGTRIYGYGKNILQIAVEDNTDIIVDSTKQLLPPKKSPKETIQITGEIVDPKCFFGVMKPGEGKVHRSCAIRCIAGGIPPVLVTENKQDYFILVSDNINQRILPFVGQPIRIKGEVSTYGDWNILRIDMNSIQSLIAQDNSYKPLPLLDNAITMCSDKK